MVKIVIQLLFVHGHACGNVFHINAIYRNVCTFGNVLRVVGIRSSLTNLNPMQHTFGSLAKRGNRSAGHHTNISDDFF